MANLPPWPLEAGLTLTRVLLAIALIYLILPLFIIPRRLLLGPVAPTERAIWMVFGSTVIVHVLVVTRLFEAIFFLVLVLMVGAFLWMRAVPAGTLRSIGTGFLGWFFDLIDGKGYLPWRQPTEPVQRNRAWWPLPWAAVTSFSVLVGILGVAAWMRFQPAFATAAPFLSDAPVNIAWMKYMENGVLYHNEVYPRGMYAFLTLVKKFTGLNSVAVLHVTGPLLGLLIVLSVAFFVHKVTKSLTSAAIGALIYGTLPTLLPMEFDRQAAHNSQEYGLIFVLPAAWYMFAYLVNGKPTDRITAAAAAGVAAFTHPVPTLFAIAAGGAASFAGLLAKGRKAWVRLPGLIGWIGTAGVVAAIPIGVALLTGQSWHGSSVEYLGETAAAALPPPNPVHLWALAGAALLTMAGIAFAWLKRDAIYKEVAASRAAAAAVVMISLLIYLSPYLGIHSAALIDRRGEIASVGLAVAGALAWDLIERSILRRQVAATVLVAMIAGGAWYRYPPTPGDPYPYFSDLQIRQYLAADGEYPPGTWTLVMGFTGYPLAVGRGLHETPDEFIAAISKLPPDYKDWLRVSDQRNLGLTPHYILVIEHQVKQAPFQGPKDAAPRLEAGKRLSRWIEDHRPLLPLHLEAEDSEVSIWTMEIPEDRSPYAIFSPEPPPTGDIRR